MPLNVNNVITQDTLYELPVVGGEPPIRVTARAGTHVTFAPDVTDKRLSVTRIPANRVPMPLEDGRATNLYISVQPSGAIFDPPLEVTFPNYDQQPANAKVLLMSFDHDAGRYVQVGTGHVSADGKNVSGDPGSGIRIGAWHGFPPASPPPDGKYGGKDPNGCDPLFGVPQVENRAALPEQKCFSCSVSGGRNPICAGGVCFSTFSPGLGELEALCAEKPGVLSVKVDNENNPNPPLPYGRLDSTGLTGEVRIFPDADSPDASKPEGQPRKRVRINIQTTSRKAGTPVYLRSYDVRDSVKLFSPDQTGGGDNQSSPKEGRFVGGTTALTDANGLATSDFEVTMQPGDNFKVVASIDQTIFSQLAIDGQKIVYSGISVTFPEEVSFTDKGNPAVSSKLLTVWRRLHVEVDSMPDPLNNETDEQRNYISGKIIRIEESRFEGNANKIIVDQSLRDGSLDVESTVPKGEAQGRFEDGVLKITGLQEITISGIYGNGINYLRKAGGFDIPYKLQSADGKTVINKGSVMALKGNIFTIAEEVSSTAYDGGTLIIAGNQFKVVKVRKNTTLGFGSDITIIDSNPVLPFLLVDDDTAKAPFLKNPGNQQEGTPFTLMQDSFDKNKNAFAAAFIKPIYDLISSKNPSFQRNVGGQFDRFEEDEKKQIEQAVTNQLLLGKEYSSAENYWYVYVQGSFQSTTREDRDPSFEQFIINGKGGLILGEVDEIGAGNGALIHLETAGEYLKSKKVTNGIEVIITHEVGHLFNGDHDDHGLMDKGNVTNREFSEDTLRKIRTISHPMK